MEELKFDFERITTAVYASGAGVKRTHYKNIIILYQKAKAERTRF